MSEVLMFAGLCAACSIGVGAWTLALGLIVDRLHGE